jgi:NAD(P)H dehydrogenase (quinone)
LKGNLVTKIIVTGATGNIGRLTLQHLLSHHPAKEIVGLAREPGKAADLSAHGIQIRSGDYFDIDSLLHAFEGVEKVMLVSATAFTDRRTQHRNVIKAAKQAGLRHIVFMPIIRKEGSSYNLPRSQMKT